MSISRGSFFWLARLTTCVSKRQRLSFRPVGPHAARPAQRQIHFSLRATSSLCQPQGYLADRTGNAGLVLHKGGDHRVALLVGPISGAAARAILACAAPHEPGVAFAVGAQLLVGLLVGRLDRRNNSQARQTSGK